MPSEKFVKASEEKPARYADARAQAPRVHLAGPARKTAPLSGEGAGQFPPAAGAHKTVTADQP